MATSNALDVSAPIEAFAESSESSEIDDNLMKQAKHLMLCVYDKKTDVEQTVEVFSAHKFLNNRSTLLKLLPPTEDAFRLHVKRAAYATIIDKSAHIARQDLHVPPAEDYG